MILTVLQKQKTIHRDIAARNFLLDESEHVKLSDFGMARRVQQDLYSPSSSGALPVRWYDKRKT
jgi:serine/threonine protein kinase